MPELPEVETVKNILEPLIINKTITKIDVFYDRLVQSDLSTFKSSLVGKTFLSMSRYGKYLFFNLSDDLILISHLRMEGKYRVTDKNFRIKSTSAIFYLDNGQALCYDDTRKFGLMYLTNKNEISSLPMIEKLGIEANKVKESDLPLLYKKFHKKKKIKELLLDQTILTGIGNIYADEILYSSKINPFTEGIELNNDNIKNITQNAKIILDKAIKAGGSTIHSFHPSEGVDGRFQESLKCYGRGGEICPICRTTFHKTFIGGRGTTYCPNCQIDKKLEKAIAITGPIGSGKSQVLNYLKSKNYFTLSADTIIHQLYEDSTIKNKISKILQTDFDINNPHKKAIARDIMINDSSKKKAVENYIYPILENYLIENIKTHDLVAYEIPLLFKAHFEYMFKTIFVIEISKEKQIENLKNRGELNTNKMLKLNNDYHYNKTSNKIKIIENNGTLADLFEKINSFIN